MSTPLTFRCDVDQKRITGVRYRCLLHEEFDTCGECRLKHPCPMVVVPESVALPAVSAFSFSSGFQSSSATPVAPVVSVTAHGPTIAYSCAACKKSIHFERFTCLIGCWGPHFNFCGSCRAPADTQHSHPMVSHLVGNTKYAAEAFWADSVPDKKSASAPTATASATATAAAPVSDPVQKKTAPAESAATTPWVFTFDPPHQPQPAPSPWGSWVPTRPIESSAQGSKPGLATNDAVL